MDRLSHEILMAEDTANDAELTLGALSEINLANHVVLVEDGSDALDYLYRRGTFARKPQTNSLAARSEDAQSERA